MVKFLVGLFVGGFIGVMMMALCVASGNADREEEKKMMTVINHDKARVCRDCKFHKVKMGIVPEHYCAAALPNEDWEIECPLEVKDDSQEEKVTDTKWDAKCPNCGRIVKAWDVEDDGHWHLICPYCGARLMGEKNEESV